MRMEHKITLNQLHAVASDIIKKLEKSHSETATVLALSGDLGSGKTTLTQEIGKQLGVRENIISPTFVIMKSYQIENKVFKNLIHIDAYRLNKSSELFHLGWQELFANKNNLILIEWPENVPDCIPEKACRIKLFHAEENTRTIEFYN
jgi:tRNA threonylcarbamoyladenosine biosynthesis protein TsaE